jgi:hypothetical protein
MKLTPKQMKLIREGIIDHVINWITDKQYWKAKKMFEDDPELQKIIVKSMGVSSQQNTQLNLKSSKILELKRVKSNSCTKWQNKKKIISQNQ